VADLSGGWAEWVAGAEVEVGAPFLISPLFEYDVVLNDFFQGLGTVGAAPLTRTGYARDLAAFLSFLWSGRGRRSWRDATEADHLAYLFWRRRDPDGPRVSGATWNREVAAVDQFYRWALRAGHVQVNPIPRVPRRSGGWEGGRRRAPDQLRAATYAHDAAGTRVGWLPPRSYRRWRDVGVRGFGSDDLPRPEFRGRWAARNACFCDVMVRTGLRLSEQAALTVFDVPAVADQPGGYQRFWLPAAAAKGGSARWVYVPSRLVGGLADYARWDRAEVVERAREGGRYERWRRPWLVEDPGRPEARRVGSAQRVKVTHLGLAERRELLVDGPDGLSPAWFWLGESGEPLTVSAWKAMFAEANRRCAAAGVSLRCHAHLLRHTFAVVTLEQLQRGHLAALADMNQAGREHYTRVFGDPLDWVRRRLGHRSVITTQIYLHALAELEMRTRMLLVPDDWEDPRDTGVADQPDGGGHETAEA